MLRIYLNLFKCEPQIEILNMIFVPFDIDVKLKFKPFLWSIEHLIIIANVPSTTIKRAEFHMWKKLVLNS